MTVVLSDHDPVRKATSIDHNGLIIYHLKSRPFLEGHVTWLLRTKRCGKWARIHNV